VSDDQQLGRAGRRREAVLAILLDLVDHGGSIRRAVFELFACPPTGR
jgi:hypothetical protein